MNTEEASHKAGRAKSRTSAANRRAASVAVDPGGEAKVDGRRQRGDTNRAKIVEALMTSIRDGNFSPNAARIAEIAGVSLRTVFRHFEEMDSLYQQIAETMQARVLPAFFRPYASERWRDRLLELMERRIELYEAILPFKISGDLRRFQSEYLANDYRQYLRLEKLSLEAVLPAEIEDDADLLHALRAVLSFQNWRTLRQDLELDTAAATAAMRRTVEALLPAAAVRAKARPASIRP